MKVGKVIQQCITGLLMVLIAVLLFIFFIPQCLGYKPYNIQTGSMTPKYPVGSMIYVKSIPFDQLQVGDVITYHTGDGSGDGWVVTHRVTQIDSGNQMLVTKGDANNTEDGSIMYASVIGKATDFCIPFLGQLVTRYQNSNGKMITIIGIVFLLGISFLMDVLQKETEQNEE